MLGWSGKEGMREQRGFPSWATIPSYRSLTDGRRWHFFFAWLFRDVNQGTLLERAAAWRHNRAQAHWLPTYMRRWFWCGALLYLLGTVAESLLDALGARLFDRAAMHATMELLGDAARPFIAGLIHCQDSAMLRDAIDGIKVAVTARCSAGAAKLLVETVRAAARLDD